MRRWRRSIKSRLHIRSGSRSRSEGRSGGGSILPCAVLGIGLALALIAFIMEQLRPTMTVIATAVVTNTITSSINQAISDCVADENVTYGDIITIEKDADGRIIALTGNMTALNSLQTDIMSRVVKAVDGIDNHEFSVPAGNLTGIAIFSGKGLELPVRVISVTYPSMEFKQVFTDAGINQTLHQVMLELTATAEILIPGRTITREIITQVCIAQTVIVGDVPNTYLQVGK